MWLIRYQHLGPLGVRNLMAGQAGLEAPDKLSSSKTPARLSPAGDVKPEGFPHPSPKEVTSQRRVVGTHHHLSTLSAAMTAMCALAAPAASSPDVASLRATLSPRPVSPSFGELFPPFSWPGRAASCLRESGAPARPVLTFPKTLAAARRPPGTRLQEHLLK